MFLRSDLMDTHAVLIYSSMRIGPEGSKLNLQINLSKVPEESDLLKVHCER